MKTASHSAGLSGRAAKAAITASVAALVSLAALDAVAQPPQGFNYQAVVRDAQGQPLKSKTASVRIRILRDSANGTQAYSELHSPVTSAYGNINLVVGKGNATGTFSAIDWSAAPMFLNVAVDPAGGTAYVDVGTTQLMSVPYAMYSGRSGTSAGDGDADPANEIQVLGAGGGSITLSKGGGSVPVPVPIEIHDADANTKVTTERGANDNVIRFDISGTEKMRLTGSRLEFPNSGNSVIIGDSAGLNDDLTNNQNVFLGPKAGKSNTTGTQNVFAGYGAGLANSTGFFNVFVGPNAAPYNTTGYSNVAVGGDAGSYNSTGMYNTCIGAGAGTKTTEGKRNTYIGAGAMGGFLDSGNVFIGYGVGESFTTVGVTGSNRLAIDNSTTTTPLLWGDFAVDSLRVNGKLSAAGNMTAPAFVVGSDRRLKENIKPLPDALEKVSRLKGVYYTYKSPAPDGNPYPTSRQIGVIAQDVEKVYPELVVTSSTGYKAVDYPKFSAILIEAVKDLKGENAALERKLEALTARMTELEAASRRTAADH